MRKRLSGCGRSVDREVRARKCEHARPLPRLDSRECDGHRRRFGGRLLHRTGMLRVERIKYRLWRPAGRRRQGRRRRRRRQRWRTHWIRCTVSTVITIGHRVQSPSRDIQQYRKFFRRVHASYVTQRLRPALSSPADTLVGMRLRSICSSSTGYPA